MSEAELRRELEDAEAAGDSALALEIAAALIELCAGKKGNAAG